jgi:hypothetical protein
VLRLFPGVLLVNGRRVLVGDGIKAANRSGRKMSAVKSLHPQSDSKPRYTIGHSLQTAINICTSALRNTRRRERVKRKMHAYQMFLQTCVVCRGLLQYLSATLPDLAGAPSAPDCAPRAPESRPQSW